MEYSVGLMYSIVGLAVIAFVVLFTSGIFGFIVVVCIALVVYFLLNMFGQFNVSFGSKGLEIDFHENSPAGHEEKKDVHAHIKEVFHISDNLYTYDEAPAVCAAYGADLASRDQIQEAFSLGAEWCSYGWSAGGTALYPTQESTWSALQSEPQETKRTACGLPGVNGGYFDPKLKFGVNCYGVKPKNQGLKFPQPLPSENPQQFNKMVDKFKRMLNSIKVSGFNRDIWSESKLGKDVGL